ncbi:MAG: exodeoxyribonuclease VII large subunit [Raoultibacter sp.]
MQAKETNSELLSVSSALALAKNALESFTVKLVGEVSELNNKPGYKAVYFTVKDDKASLPCMMWLNRYNATGIEMKVGMLVEITGRFTLYAAKGRMNFDAFDIAIAGEGNLRLQVANLAKRLESEGLMSPDRKQAIPQFPETIGIVTSPRGAAVHDVLRTLRRRFPLSKVKLAGVPVEGDKAAAGIAEALQCIESSGCELVLLVRGGGSFEDLMPFNDEALARVISSLRIPVITGIGHEPDTSIADMVADFRASTPTAAAEAATPSPDALISFLNSRKDTMQHHVSRRLERSMNLIDQIENRPIFKDVNMLFAQDALSIDSLEDRLRRAIPINLKRDNQALELSNARMQTIGRTLNDRFSAELSFAASRMHDLSPLTVLSRGYAIAKNDEGLVLRSPNQVALDEKISVSLGEGTLFCRVEGKEDAEYISMEEHE